MGTVTRSSGGASTPTAPTYTQGAYGLNTGLTSITGGTAGVKVAAVSIGTLSQAVDLLSLEFYYNANRAFLIDVIAAGTIIAADLPVTFTTGSVCRFSLPLRIPAGALTISHLSNGTNQALIASAFAATATLAETNTLIEAIAPAGSSALTTGVSGVTVNNVAPAMTQIGSALANAITGFIPSLSTNSDTTRTSTSYLLEIGTGADATAAAANLLPGHWLYGSNTVAVLYETNRLYRQAFPAGTIFWARVTSSADPSATAPETCNIQLHGVR